jgi:hypothetical protein
VARALAAARGALPPDGEEAKGRSLKPRADYLKALGELLARAARSLERAPKEALPVRVYIAGGAALHLLTGARISEDLDAVFSRRVLLPDALEVSYRDADGSARTLYLDRNYNDTLGLLHEDAYDDSRPVRIDGVDPKLLEPRVLTALDLAVTKLARFSQQDREDIELLARQGLIDSAALRTRAEQALGGYVGDLESIRTSIDVACRLVDSIRPPKRRRPRIRGQSPN